MLDLTCPQTSFILDILSDGQVTAALHVIIAWERKVRAPQDQDAG